MKYLNLLSIFHEFKTIPYKQGGIPRENGDKNHGFKLLKNNLGALDQIPEIKKDDYLKKIIISMNQPETSVFSVGCVSGYLTRENQYSYAGYVEFAINSREAVQDACSYFKLFFDYDQYLISLNFDIPVKIDWQIQPAYFKEVDVSGFSIGVTINTEWSSTQEEAYKLWSKAIETISKFLSQWESFSFDNIY